MEGPSAGKLRASDVWDRLGETMLPDMVPVDLLTYALVALGAEDVYAAYTTMLVPTPTEDNPSRYEIWFACDVGLVCCRAVDHGDREPSAKCDVTSWRDVRDVELTIDTAESELVPIPSTLTLSVQLPRILVSASGAGHVRALRDFARNVLMQYQNHH